MISSIFAFLLTRSSNGTELNLSYSSDISSCFASVWRQVQDALNYIKTTVIEQKVVKVQGQAEAEPLNILGIPVPFFSDKSISLNNSPILLLRYFLPFTLPDTKRSRLIHFASPG